MHISCSHCATSLSFRPRKGLCACGTAYYCSRECATQDKGRHAKHCSSTEAARLLHKSFFQAAALFRVSCKIFRDPCEAYAYALLMRLGMPKQVLGDIIRSEPGDPYLYKILRRCKFDALSFVTTIYTVVEMATAQTQAPKPDFSHARLPPPEVYVVVARYELATLARAEDMNALPLYLMVTAQDPALGELSVLARMQHSLMSMYDCEADSPLQDLVDALRGSDMDEVD